MSKKIHFIAIGGSAMHNLAIALKRQGFDVSGSDDEIYEPSKSRLTNENILPAENGWFPEKINTGISAVILGMHASLDNPELIKAQSLGLKIYSYPEYIYEASKEKQRIVIAGSHGKTTISSIIIHVLNYAQKEFDYLVGAHLEGFDNMVKLTNAPIIIIEGDEYLASPLNRIPKFLQYKHHIAVISGIAWDHVNVFPTFEEYSKQFSDLATASPKAGALIFNEDDKLVNSICTKELADVARLPYSAHSSKIKDGVTYLTTEGTGILGLDKTQVPIKIFGEHNLYNISAALKVCERIGVDKDTFYAAIQSFKGANNRLEILESNANTLVFIYFAHSPSKLQATTTAVKKQYPKRDLVAVYELHTFSSLTSSFLSQYKETIDSATIPVVYYNPDTLKHKNIEGINKDTISKAFANKNLKVYDSIVELKAFLETINYNQKNLLLMSSGNFASLNLKDLAKNCLK